MARLQDSRWHAEGFRHQLVQRLSGNYYDCTEVGINHGRNMRRFQLFPVSYQPGALSPLASPTAVVLAPSEARAHAPGPGPAP